MIFGIGTDIVKTERFKATKESFLRYAFTEKELEEANIEIGEEEALLEERMILQNSEKLTSNLQKALVLAEGDGDIEGAVSIIDNLCTVINKSAELNPNLLKLSENLNDIYYNFQDCVSEMI